MRYQQLSFLQEVPKNLFRASSFPSPNVPTWVIDQRGAKRCRLIKILKAIITSEEIHALPKVRFVVCLDSVGLGSTLKMHVSKPPKEGSPSYKFLADLQKVSSLLNPEVS